MHTLYLKSPLKWQNASKNHVIIYKTGLDFFTQILVKNQKKVLTIYEEKVNIYTTNEHGLIPSGSRFKKLLKKEVIHHDSPAETAR